jgi:hypothetical protein
MNTLNETNYQDLPLEVLNVDIHNTALFMFLSMLKCSVMGNYKLRENAYVARESVHQETKYCDAVWYNPKDEWDQLLIEVKTRKVGNHEVGYIDRIIKDVMSKIRKLLDLGQGNYVVPIIIYKKEHRSLNKLWNADMMIMSGNRGGHHDSIILPISEWYSILANVHDIDDLMLTLLEVNEQTPSSGHFSENWGTKECEEAVDEYLAMKYSEEEEQEEQEEQEEEEQEEQEEEEQEEDSRSWGSRSWGSRPLEERRFSLAAIGYMVIHYCVKTKDQLITIKGITEQVKATFHQGLHQKLKHPSWWKESLPKMIRDDLIKMVVVNDLDAFEVTKDNIIKDENSRTFFNFKIEDYQLLIDSKQMSEEELECLKIPLSQYELIRVEDEGLNDSE